MNMYKHAEAIKLLEEARELDPQSAAIHGYLSFANLMDVWLGSTANRAESIEKAFDYAEKCKALNDELSACRQMLSGVHLQKREYEKAISEGKKATELEPNNALAALWNGWTLRSAGRYEAALSEYERAIRLDPLNTTTPIYHKCATYNVMRQHEDAIATCKKVLEANPKYLPAYYQLAVAYSTMNRMEEARESASEILKKNPNFTVENWAKGLPYKKEADIDLIVNGLRKAGLPDKPPLPLPDKPSIAVLAFDNLSNDPEQEYFSDGIAEDIITALSKTPKMFVIARNSSFTYKGKPVKVQQIGRELGVRYVLEGSVRKTGDKVRINAQLIDAQTGRHLWADKYDRELKDILALQDEITKSIITELQVKLTEGEQARIPAKGANNLDAFLKVLEARDIMRVQNIENNRKARNLLERAIELDPDYAPAYRWLSASHFLDILLGESNSPADSIKRAFQLSKKALSIDNSLGDAHAWLGILYVWTKQSEKGMPELEKAVELYPNAADIQSYLAAGLLYSDELDKAILVQKKAIRLNPMSPSWYFNNLAAMYRSKGDFKEALVWGERAVKQDPEYIIGNVHLCSVYYLLGREEDAHLQAKKVLKLNPNFSLKKLERTLPYKNPEVKKQYIDALRNAGLPD
jgi:TolB-like protein/Tfp pilus assembly protein PilF